MSAAERLKGWARKVKRDGVTLWFASRHPEVPWPAKALGLFVVAYALSPIDLIPDFIPVLGYLDDLILLPLGIYLALKIIHSGGGFCSRCFRFLEHGPGATSLTQERGSWLWGSPCSEKPARFTSR